MPTLYQRLRQRYNPVDPADRRRFMQSTLAGGLGLLLSETVSRGQTSTKPRRVVVVGAGFAGLACAHELKSVGYQVTVIEARNRVGGRVLSFHDFVTGKTVEGGAELVGSNHPTWLAYAEKFGLGFIDLSEDDEYSMPIYLGGRLLEAEEGEKIYEQMEESYAVFTKLAEPINADEPWKSPDAAKLDAQTVASVIAKLEVSDLVKQLMAIQIGSDNAIAVEKQSLLGLLTSVAGGGGETYWTETETQRCNGGNDLLAKKLFEAVGADRFRLKLEVESIRYGNDVVIVTCVDGRTIECDDVVLAVPPSTWDRITFTPELPAMLKPQMGTAVKYLSAVKSRFWYEDKRSQYAITDGLISQTWEGTDAQPNDPTTACLVSFSGGPQADACLRLRKDERDPAYAKEYAKIYPKFGEQFIQSRMMDWPNDPQTRGGYSFPAPGQVTTVGPILRQGLHNRLHFAGEHTCYKFVGYMEGGLNSGASLARRLAIRDGLAKPDPS